MCDYSLMEVPNRLAAEGESLQVFDFPTGTKGLISAVTPQRSFWQQVKEFFVNEPEQLPCAVCVPPGARLTIHNFSPAIQAQFNVNATEEVTFTQLHVDEGYHRDAIRFSSGQALSLQILKPGQPVEIVRLSLAEEEETAPPVIRRQIYEMVDR